MLALAGRPGERFFIGDDIVLEIVRVARGNQVTLAFEAPRHVRIDREKIRNDITAQECEEERAVADRQTDGGA